MRFKASKTYGLPIYQIIDLRVNSILMHQNHHFNLISIYRSRERELEEHECREDHSHGDHSTPVRTFRYMRRKPTIIAYKPPEGKLFIQKLLSVNTL